MGFSAAFTVAALVNWWVVSVANSRVVLVAKPLALLALVGVAIAGGAGSHTPGWWLLAGLVLCLAGDVFLLGD